MIDTAISLSTRGHFRILKSGHFNFLLTPPGRALFTWRLSWMCLPGGLWAGGSAVPCVQRWCWMRWNRLCGGTIRTGLIHHSDRGSQYLSMVLAAAGEASVGIDSYDNALALSACTRRK